MGLWDWLEGLRERPSLGPELTITARVIMQEESPEVTAARRAATAHARAGDYNAAVSYLERLRELYISAGSPPDCAVEIRRAKYLQKAGRGVEAWQIFLQLLNEHGDDWLLVDVLDAMRLHLQREGQSTEAITYGAAHHLACVAIYRKMRAEAQAALAGPIEAWGSEDLERQIRRNHQSSIDLADKWLSQLTDPADLTALATTLCKKAGMPEQVNQLVEQLGHEIERQTRPLDYLKAVESK
jgi:hypothetical protein